MAGVITPAQYVGGGGGGSVASVFGRSGAVVATTGDYTVAQVTGAAPIASPALTGTPTAPTQVKGDTSTEIATDAFAAIAAASVQVVTATVSPVGTAAGTTFPNNGADYGPDTAGTTTSGLQEALTALQSTGGKIVLRQGAFTIASPMTYTSDYSLTIEGETRGRAENVTASTNSWGVYLMVNTLGAGAVALTINTNTLNLGMLKLLNFTVRGQPLGYTGTTAGSMLFLATGTTGTLSPAQIEMDNVSCEYIAVPCIKIANSQNGPVIIGWLMFAYCGTNSGAGLQSAMLEMQTGTCHIGHLEAWHSGSPVVGVFGSAGNYSYIDIDSVFSNQYVFSYGCNGAAPATFLHIGAAFVLNTGDSLIYLDATAGSLSAHVDQVSFSGTSQEGSVIQGTANSTSGTVQVTIGSIYGNPSNLINNGSAATVGAGSFLEILSAYFTAALNADVPFANMTEYVRTAATAIAVIDATATDIAADGVQAAGSVGKAADAGHVHPENVPWIAADSAYLAVSMPIELASSGSAATSGTVYMNRIQVRETITVTNVVVFINGAGSGLTASECFAGLYAGQTAGGYTALELIAATAEQHTAWATTGPVPAALTGGPYVLPPGFYWVAVLSNGTTNPSFARTGSFGAAAVLNAGTGSSSYRSATAGTGQATLPAGPVTLAIASSELLVALS
jgi:hypothetical protein